MIPSELARKLNILSHRINAVKRAPINRVEFLVKKSTKSESQIDELRWHRETMTPVLDMLSIITGMPLS